jgi:exosome complex RNA-binding protein Rrp42 (RNase PH superfamily)
MTKKSVGKPPRDPNTIRFTVDAYLTPAQIEWYKKQGKSKAGTLITLIDNGIAEDNAIDNAKISIEIDGKVRIYQPLELIL